MMSWLELAAAVGVLGLLLAIPGLLIAFVLGFRGLWAAALAAPASVTVIALTSLVAPFLGIRWGALPVLAVTVVLAAVLLVLRRLLWRGVVPRSETPLTRGGTLFLGAGLLVVLAQVLVAIGRPANISQTFDNIFHLNAMRFILDTGNASPLWLGNMTSAESGGVPFYPSAWHAVGSLILTISGTSIPIASNALTIVFAAVVWPLSIVVLTRTLWGSRTAVIAGAAAGAAGVAAFPMLMMTYGVLFPYLMGLSMVPVALALIVAAVIDRDVDAKARVILLLAFAGTIPAIGVSHPGAFVALLVLSSAILAVALVLFLRARPSAARNAWIWIGVAGYLVVAGAAWYVLRPPAPARTWLQTETVSQAIGEVLAVSPFGAAINLGIAALVGFGVVAAVRRRDRASIVALVSYVVLAGLFVTVSGLPYLLLRDILTGAWYNNAPRLAALLPLAWVPLVGLGVAAAWDGVQRFRAAGRRRLALGALVALVVAAVVLPQAMSMRQAVSNARAGFALTEKSELLTLDEMAILERLDQHVPEDAVIAGSPWTGTALAYALSDREVLLRHTLTDVSKDAELVNDELDEAEAGSPVCAAIHRLGVEFVLDFGRQEVNGGRHPSKGLDRLATSSAVELVDEEGRARLYRVTACGDAG
ncbi:DUF6541 family protein [Microbacterium resistens]|uniref:DUF6541 family protein n=1 Tax=Microbacterium resistens TaxID=156977 RepID=UPI003671A1ED